MEKYDSKIESLNNIFEKIPEVQAEIGLWQNKFHEFDVFKHSKEFVKNIENLTTDKNMIAAGWLHDIGKVITAKTKVDEKGNPIEKEPGKPYHDFIDHEIVGEEMVRKLDPEIFTKFELDQDKVAKLVGCHYIPILGIRDMRKTKNFNEFTLSFNKLNDQLSNASVSKEEVLTMFLADKLAQGKFCTDKDELFLIRETLLNPKIEEKDLTKIYKIHKLAYGNKE